MFDINAASPAISADGRYVSFQGQSSGTNGPAGINQIWVRDLRKGTTRGRTRKGKPAYGEVGTQAISSSGKLVVFRSLDPDLPGGGGTYKHIYLRDVPGRRTTRIIDKAPNGDPPDAGVHDPSISLDGRFVTFYGVPTNLGATPPWDSVFRAGPIS